MGQTTRWRYGKPQEQLKSFLSLSTPPYNYGEKNPTYRVGYLPIHVSPQPTMHVNERNIWNIIDIRFAQAQTRHRFPLLLQNSSQEIQPKKKIPDTQHPNHTNTTKNPAICVSGKDPHSIIHTLWMDVWRLPNEQQAILWTKLHSFHANQKSRTRIFISLSRKESVSHRYQISSAYDLSCAQNVKFWLLSGFLQLR